MWLTMSVASRFFRATVAAMFYFLSIVQGVSTSYPIYPMMLTAHGPKYQNLLLPTMSIDRQRGLSIVVDNGHWQERLRGHCVAAMIYLLYVQGVADQVSPTQSTNHNTTDNATHLTPMMLIALLLRHTTLKHPLTLYSYHAPIAAHHDTSCTHFIPMWSQ